MKRNEPFVVGRRTPKGTTVVLLRGTDRPIFPGPWTLRAVVTPRQKR
jgi:hypothetical protein